METKPDDMPYEEWLSTRALHDPGREGAMSAALKRRNVRNANLPMVYGLDRIKGRAVANWPKNEVMIPW